ncbi:MAG TPA: hypothetical protein VF122_05585 [Caulobacteraceae bacterium]
MSETTAADDRGEVDRNLALLAYGLLFVSILFAGLPGLIAVVIAYVQRDVAGPAMRSHFAYQIRIFWVALALTLVAALSALGAVAVGVGELIDIGIHHNWDAWDSVSFEISDMDLNPAIVVLLGIAGIASLATAAWLIVAPAIGFIRLVSQRGMGDRAA